MIKSFNLLAIFLISMLQIAIIYGDGNLYTSDKQNVYYIEKNLRYTWFDALNECTVRNLRLATIDTKEKSDEITALLKKVLGKSNPLWMGAVARGANAYGFSWIATGNSVDFTNFSPGEPNFQYKNEYCLQTAWNDAMQWNDHECHYQFGFICEQNQVLRHVDELELKLKQEDLKCQQFEEELKKEVLFKKILWEYLQKISQIEHPFVVSFEMFIEIKPQGFHAIKII